MAHRSCWLLVLLLAHVAGCLGDASTAQASRCAPYLSFFPKGAEDRNIPQSWGKTSQMAAGNYRDDMLFNVVLTSTNNLPGIAAEAVPVLHVQPMHPLMFMGTADLPTSCTGQGPQGPAAAAAAGAQTGQAAAGAATTAAGGAHPGDVAESAQVDALLDAEDEELVKPSTVVASAPVTASEAPTSTASHAAETVPKRGRQLLGGGVVTTPAVYRLQYSLNGSSSVDTGDVNFLSAPLQAITLNTLRSLPDGYYCLSLKLTIKAGTGRLDGSIPVPPSDLHRTTEVCFYKLDGLPTGRAAFSTCKEDLTVLFKDLHPQPIPLHPGSSKSLFHSVFHFQAALNRTKDWSWPSDATPKSLDHWLVLNAGQGAGTRQLWRPEEKVADGWYNIRLEGSMTSDYTSLLSLNVMRAGRYEGVDTPPELSERPKLLATPLYKNETVAGVQSVLTDFRQLTGTGDEAEVRLSVGDEMVFNWEFEGFGDMFCYNDEKLYNNMGDFNCQSPAQFRIPDKHNHTFRVALQDVCNHTYVVDAVYGVWGYKVVRAPPPRLAPVEEFVSSSSSGSSSEKFEIGQPANSVLRSPKASKAGGAKSAGTRAQPQLMVWLCAWLLAIFAAF